MASGANPCRPRCSLESLDLSKIVPFDGSCLSIHGVAEFSRLAFDLGPLDDRQRLRFVVVECFDVDFGAAIWRVDVCLANQLETVRAEKDDIVATLIQFLDADDLPDAADRVQRRIVVVVDPVRLDHELRQ